MTTLTSRSLTGPPGRMTPSCRRTFASPQPTGRPGWCWGAAAPARRGPGRSGCGWRSAGIQGKPRRCESLSWARAMRRRARSWWTAYPDYCRSTGVPANRSSSVRGGCWCGRTAARRSCFPPRIQNSCAVRSSILPGVTAYGRRPSNQPAGRLDALLWHCTGPRGQLCANQQLAYRQGRGARIRKVFRVLTGFLMVFITGSCGVRHGAAFHAGM